MRPTAKPRALTLSSNPGNLVFEPFAGSPSTGIACEQTGRRCAAIELSPKYTQLCIERWQAATGKRAEKIGSAP
ncbi:MAG: site-specific DNA-methyltransferase [Deltaproteobacteria bacterium]|nr:site-specific DNA-methyltransferase [Deltaproteobacteria bacterium]